MEETRCIRRGPMSKLMKNIYATKEKGLTRGTQDIMIKFCEDKVKEVLELAMGIADEDNRKGVTPEHIRKAMEKLGIDFAKYAS